MANSSVSFLEFGRILAITQFLRIARTFIESKNPIFGSVFNYFM